MEAPPERVAWSSGEFHTCGRTAMNCECDYDDLMTG